MCFVLLLLLVFVGTVKCHSPILPFTSDSDFCTWYSLPWPFTITSITWTEDGQLLLLYDEVMLVARFVSRFSPHYEIVHSVHSHSFGSNFTIDHFGQYSGIYSIGDDHWILYRKSGELELFDGHLLTVGDWSNRTHVLNKDGEGICFYFQDNELFAFDAAYFKSKSLVTQFYVKQSVTSILFSKQPVEASPSFTAPPVGFIKANTMYLFEPNSTIVYILDYGKVRENLQANLLFANGFEIHFETISIEELFLCGHPLLAWLAILTSVLLILFILTLSIWLFILETSREKDSILPLSPMFTERSLKSTLSSYPNRTSQTVVTPFKTKPFKISSRSSMTASSETSAKTRKTSPKPTTVLTSPKPFNPTSSSPLSTSRVKQVENSAKVSKKLAKIIESSTPSSQTTSIVSSTDHGCSPNKIGNITSPFEMFFPLRSVTGSESAIIN